MIQYFVLNIYINYGFIEQISEVTYIFLTEDIQKLVDNKSKYTDWTNRQEIKINSMPMFPNY